jgi:cell division septum initiation protein DivIVA
MLVLQENESLQNQVNSLKKDLQNKYDKCRCQMTDNQNWIKENDVKLLKLLTVSVVQALNREDQSWGRYGALTNEAKRLLRHVQKWKVCHVKRTANEAAHRLAKLAFSFNEERLWTEDYPVCPREIVNADLYSH